MVHRNYAEKVSRRLADEVAEGAGAGSRSPEGPAAAAFRDASGETTHLSGMDTDGNVLGLTQSIERVFGSWEASPESGFIYNNYLSTFEYLDISHPHYLRPGAGPWASVAPSIIYEENHPELVIGSPGSERIVSAIVQVLVRLHDHDPLRAVAAPRLHGALDGSVSLEQDRIQPAVVSRLKSQGFPLKDRGPWSFFMGCVQLVAREDGYLVGVADPRRDGSAEGV